jgi:hypothetical protein
MWRSVRPEATPPDTPSSWRIRWVRFFMAFSWGAAAAERGRCRAIPPLASTSALNSSPQTSAEKKAGANPNATEGPWHRSTNSETVPVFIRGHIPCQGCQRSRKLDHPMGLARERDKAPGAIVVAHLADSPTSPITSAVREQVEITIKRIGILIDADISEDQIRDRLGKIQGALPGRRKCNDIRIWRWIRHLKADIRVAWHKEVHASSCLRKGILPNELDSIAKEKTIDSLRPCGGPIHPLHWVCGHWCA